MWILQEEGQKWWCIKEAYCGKGFRNDNAVKLHIGFSFTQGIMDFSKAWIVSRKPFMWNMQERFCKLLCIEETYCGLIITQNAKDFSQFE